MPWFVTFLARRTLWGLVTVLTFVTVLFLFMQVWVPHNWATQFGMAGPDARAAATASVGLDEPLLVRYVEYMGGLVSGDLGQSFNGGAVTTIIGESMPITVMVFLTGALLGWVGGEFLGRVVAWRRNRTSRSLVSMVGVISATIFPPFLVFVLVRWFRFPLYELRELLGLPSDSLEIWRGAVTGEPGFPTQNDVRWLLALVLLVALVTGLAVRYYARRRRLPVLGTVALPLMLTSAGAGLWVSGVGPQAVDLLFRADITRTVGRGSPGLAIVGVLLISFGQIMFMMRVGMEDERSEDYVLTARAKGLRERAVRDRHVARNALTPALAGTFLAFPTIVAGMIIVEVELEMHGLSSVLFTAIEFQDIPLIMGVMVMLGLLGVALRIATDVTIAILDPRQRRGTA